MKPRLATFVLTLTASAAVSAIQEGDAAGNTVRPTSLEKADGELFIVARRTK